MAGCASTSTPRSNGTTADLRGTNCHVHVHQGFGDDMKLTISRVMLAVESAGLQRACALSHSFNHNNNPSCSNGKTKDCTYDAKWVRDTNDWNLKEAKKIPQVFPFCGIEIGSKIDTAEELRHCKNKEQALTLLKIAIDLPQTTFIFAHMLGDNYGLLADSPSANVYVSRNPRYSK